MNRSIWKIGFLATALLLIGACKDDEKKAQPAEVDEQVAVQSTQATIMAVTTLMDQNDGEAAAAAMLGMGFSYQSLLVPAESNTGNSNEYYNDDEYYDDSMVNPEFAIHGALPAGGGGASSGSCDCDEEAMSCTFQNCTEEDEEGTATINGTISWGDGKLVCDLTMSGTMNEGGYEMDFEITVKSNLTVTETSIDGTLDSTLSADMTVEGEHVSIDMESHVTYNAVTWDADTYEPTGGSIEVEASMSGSGGGESVNYSGSAEISFP